MTPSKDKNDLDVKGPAKLIQWVKIAHSFLNILSKLLHFIYNFKFVLVALHMTVK